MARTLRALDAAAALKVEAEAVAVVFRRRAEEGGGIALAGIPGAGGPEDRGAKLREKVGGKQRALRPEEGQVGARRRFHSEIPPKHAVGELDRVVALAGVKHGGGAPDAVGDLGVATTPASPLWLAA